MNVDFLQQIPLFITHTKEEANRILLLCRQRTLRKGESLVKRGQRASSLFILEAGTLAVFDTLREGEVTLAELNAGAVVGELGLLDGAPRSANVRAATNCVVHELPYDALGHLFVSLDAAAYKLVRQMSLALCERIRETNGRIAQVAEDPTIVKPKAASADAAAPKAAGDWLAGIKRLIAG